MERLIGLIAFSIILFSASAQSLDFGIEVSQNYNAVEKFESTDTYDPANHALSIRDLSGDTSNIFLYKFTMDNHVEIPLYFRYNFRKRWFLDFKLSTSVNRLQMWGVANYTDNYLTETFGTYDEFISEAALNGFTNADLADYEDYMKNARELSQSNISTVEEFKMLSFTANAGIRFFPHKSVKGFAAMGFTVKNKYQKHSYSHLDFSNDYIQNLSSIDNSLNKYADKSVYTNFQAGLEFYRFRVTGFFQAGNAYTFDTAEDGPEIVYANPFTPFDIIRSFGFSLSANLFSIDVGKRVKKDLVSEDDIIVANIQPKKEKWDIGLRFDRRGYNDLSTYYSDPEHQLSVLKNDSIIYNNWGSFVSGQNIQLLTFGDIKRVQWGGRFSAFMNIYLTKRLGLRGSLGGSNLTFDVATTELDATIIGDDTSGYTYLVAPGTPKLKSAVYRKSMNLVDLNFALTYKVVNRDLFSLSLSAGFGFSSRTYIAFSKKGSPAGVNELPVYQDFDQYFTSTKESELQLYEGQLDIDLNSSPTELLANFDTPYTGLGPNVGADNRPVFPTLNFGVEAGIERFSVGLGFEMSSTYIDQFLLSSAKSAYFSIGYKLFRR